MSAFTGFGEAPNASIKFQVLKHRDGTDPAWQGGEAAVSRFRPLHSNDVIKQYGGRDELVLTARLLFGDYADVIGLNRVVGRISTLRTPSIIACDEGTTETLPDGCKYTKVTKVELESLTDRRPLRDGRAIATATFRRAVGDASYYGYATYAEDAS